MSFLPVNCALLVAGGRNDIECKNLGTPYLNDLYLFLLDQKVWINVKYTRDSQIFDRTCNHAVTVITDNDQYERVIIFGGLSGKPT